MLQTKSQISFYSKHTRTPQNDQKLPPLMCFVWKKCIKGTIFFESYMVRGEHVESNLICSRVSASKFGVGWVLRVGHTYKSTSNISGISENVTYRYLRLHKAWIWSKYTKCSSLPDIKRSFIWLFKDFKESKVIFLIVWTYFSWRYVRYGGNART